MDATQMRPFLFEGERMVRVVDQAGAAWFVHTDVCAVLGIENARNAAARLDEDEKGVHTTDTLGGPQTLTIISESGLYNLIFKSRKPQAVRFRKWVTSEVLPALRQEGSYTMADQPPLAAPQPDVILDRPWRERPAEERRVELSTIASIRTNGNHALAWWYLSEVAKVANFPRHLLSPWQQALNFPPTGGNQLMVIMGGGNTS